MAEELADEILQLFRVDLPHACCGDSCTICEEMRKEQERQLEQEYVNGRGVGITDTDDCTCRNCHPEHWILDSRNIWIRKIGSLGDEVI